jgi:hypothetical protein
MMVSLKSFILLLLIFQTSLTQPANSTKLLPREQFQIPLAKLAVLLDDTTGDPIRVRITFGDSHDYSVVSNLDDLLVNEIRNGTEKTTYREVTERAYLISDFEATQILEVSKTLVTTLEQFEIMLQKNNIPKITYLDSYLSKFLNGFYYLLLTAQNSTDAVPKAMYIPDSLYDISINSLKSDKRIKFWLSSPDYIVKLRIVTKELTYQIKIWQKKKFSKEKSGPDTIISNDLLEAYSLFINTYFNRPAPGR